MHVIYTGYIIYGNFAQYQSIEIWPQTPPLIGRVELEHKKLEIPKPETNLN